MSIVEHLFELYQEGCSAETPLLVFLPGAGCGAFTFREAIPHFLPHYRLVLFNNPGVGDVEMPAFPTVEGIADMFLPVIRRLARGGKVILLGHSMGGFVAQKLAHSLGEGVEKLVLVSTSYGGSQNMADLSRTSRELGGDMTQLHTLYEKGIEEGLRLVVAPGFPKKHPDRFATLLEMRREEWPPQSIVVRHFVCGSRFSALPWLRGIETPTLVVHGEEDWLIAPEGGKRLAGQLACARYWAIPQCGHFPYIEKENFYDRVFDWLQGAEVGVKMPQSPPPVETGGQAFSEWASSLWERLS